MIEEKKLRQGIPLFFLCVMTAVFFCRLQTVTDAMSAALSLCAFSLIPSIFPFLLLTELLLHLPFGKRLLFSLGKPFSFFFRCSPIGASAYLFGLLFGFPLGTKALAEYRKEGLLSQKEAERLMLFCNNTGPAFLIGGVGYKLFGSLKTGLFLYLIQAAVSFLFGCLLGIKAEKKTESNPYRADASVFSFSTCMRNAVLQMLSICGYVAFFSVSGALFSPLVPSLPLRAVFYGFLEVGTACAFIKNASMPLATTLPLLAFAVSFSGISVYLQSLDYVGKVDIKTRYYLFFKLLQASLSLSFAAAFSFFLT